jgi:hypothetical protein
MVRGYSRDHMGLIVYHWIFLQFTSGRVNDEFNSITQSNTGGG